MAKPDQLSDALLPIYRTAFERMNQGFCLLEKVATPPDAPPDFRYLLTNPAFEEQSGLQQVVGKTIREVVPQVEGQIMDHYGQVALTGEPVHFHEYVATLNNWVDVHAFRTREQHPPQIAVLFTNITEQKRAEESLTKSEARKAFLLQLSDSLRSLADPVDVQATTTRTAMTYFGAERCYYCEIEKGKAIIRRDASRPDLPSVAGEYALDSMPIFKAVVEAGQPCVVRDLHTTNLLDESLKELCLQMQIISFMDVPIIKNGQPVGILCITQSTPRDWTDLDIELAQETAERTWAALERVRAEEALRESQRFVQGMITSLPVVIYMFDLVERKNLFLSPQVTERFGYSIDEMQASGVDLLPTFFHPDDLPRLTEYFERIIRSAEDQIVSIECRIKHKQRGWVWVVCRDIVYARDAQGVPTQLLGTAEDISERKQADQILRQSEARQRAILESAKDYAIFTTDLDRRVNSWNKGAQAVFGYAEKEIMHQLADLLFTPEDRQQGVPQRERQKAISEGRAENERWHIRQDGSRFYGSGVVTPLRDEASSIIGLLKVMRDLTAQKRAEEALQEADRRKDEFLAMLAHELRNPMATVRNGLNILDLITDKSDGVIRQTVGMMNRQVDHLVRLVDDLLDVSRISTGKIELKRERIELSILVAGAVDAIRPQYTAHHKQLHFTRDLIPLLVYGDSTRLSQVVTNLLTNGLRYTGGQGQVWISLNEENGEAVLRVADNGIGLSADQRTAIFDLFVQADTSLARSQGGLGIGLTLVKRLVEMHGGRVEAHSPGLGQSSEFVVYLPLLAESKKEAISMNTRTAAQPTSHRVLVIDDNPDAVLTLSMMLKLKGYEVHSCNSGREGIQAAEQLHPTVILCDIGMPELDGYETCRLFRQQPWGKEITLIALTGYGQEEDKRQTKEAGFNDHLVKPVDLAVLTRILAELPIRGT